MARTREGERVDVYSSSQATRYGELMQGVTGSGYAKFIKVTDDGKIQTDISVENMDVNIGDVGIVDENENPITGTNPLPVTNKTQTGYTSPSSYTLVYGSVGSGTLENAKHKDKTYFVIDEDTTNGMEIIFDFTLPAGEKPRKLIFCGRYDGGAGHKIDVYLWDYDNSTWKHISTPLNKDIIPTENDVHMEWDFDNPDLVDANGNAKVKIEHVAATYDSGHSLYIDHIAVGDYKAPELLARIKDDIELLHDITDRGYMTFKAETGKTVYNITDPRIKDADPDRVKIYADIDDDADFKGFRVPIVDVFTTENASQAPYIMYSNYAKMKRTRIAADWDDAEGYLFNPNRDWFLLNLPDNRILEMFVRWRDTTTANTEFNWRVLPENFTEKEANSIPFTHQTFNTTSDLAVNTTNLASIRARMEYYNNALYVWMMYPISHATLDLEWKLLRIDFDTETGVSNFVYKTMLQGYNNSKNFIAMFKTESGDLYCVKPYYELTTGNITGIFVIKPNQSVTGYEIKTISGISSYYSNSGCDLIKDYTSSVDDDFLLVLGSAYDTISIYKINFTNSTQSLYKTIDLNSFNEDVDGIETGDGFFAYSRDDGELVISFVDDYDGDRDYIYSQDYGATFSFEKAGTWSWVGRATINTDKLFFMANGAYASKSAIYYVYPLDRSKFIEAIIDYDDLIVTFSKSPVGGTKFYITEYQNRNVVLKNETTFDETGKPIIKPIITEEHVEGKKVSATNPFPVIPYDVSGVPSNPIDPITGLRATTDSTHYEIHEGNMWNAVYKFTGPLTGVPKYFLFKASATKEPHTVFRVTTDQKLFFEVYENPTITAEGTDITSNIVHNADLNITSSPASTIFEDPTVTDDGHLVEFNYTDKVEVGTRDNERILVSGSYYLVKIIPDKDNPIIGLLVNWYEE